MTKQTPFDWSGLGNEDIVLRGIANEQAFDKLPIIVSKDELEKIIEDGSRELYRGLSESKFVEQFKYGDYFAGKGMYGSGTYTAYGDRAYMTARTYAGKAEGNRVIKNTILRMSIDKNAKIIELNDLRKEIEVYTDKLDEKYYNLKETFKAEGKDITDLNEELRTILSLTTDPGRFAAMNGYDAIEESENKYLILLNRGCVYVQDEPI